MTQVPKTNVINDPFLGKLVYTEYSSPDSCNFDKSSHVCKMPFTDAEIRDNGDVYTCCPAWNPVSVGNVLETDLRDIWTGFRAKILRNSVSDGTYKYCNHKTCPSMIAGGGPYIIPKREFVDPNRSIPKNFSFSLDKSCNLTCPSCRTSAIRSLSNNSKARDVLKAVFKSVFNEPHNDEVIMTFDGAGEIFFSSLYRELFDTEEVFQAPEKWPNFKVVLCTNGIMMTKKIQETYHTLFERAASVRISVDAGNKASYEKVRQGGVWEVLWKNLDFLYDNTLKNDPSKFWAWNLILQDDNFESLPELIDIAYQYPENLPEIYITNLLNWGTLEDYATKAVWLSTAPRHEQLKEILALPKVKNYPKIFNPLYESK